MPDLTDFAAAQQALMDPQTSPADLAIIAQHHPSLRVFVANHPAAYPGLLDWLDALGEPTLCATIQRRRQATQGTTPSQFVPVPSAPLPLAPTSVGQQPLPQTAPVRGTSKRRLIGIVSGVVVLAILAAGFFVVILPRLKSADSWSTTYGGDFNDYFYGVAIAANEDVIAVGSTGSTDGDFALHSAKGDALIVRYGRNGDVVWAKTYGGQESDQFYAVAVAPNGDIVAVGGSETAVTDPLVQDSARDWIIARYDGKGNLLWAKTYGGTDGDSIAGVVIHPGGDIIVAGVTYSTDGDFPARDGVHGDAVIARLTSDGNLLWAKTYGGNDYDGFAGVALADNGDIVAVGLTHSTDGDFPALSYAGDALIARFNQDGNLLWADTYGGSSDEAFSSVAVATNGDIIAAGKTTSTDGDFLGRSQVRGDLRDAVLARVSGDGELLWLSWYGGQSRDEFRGVTVAASGDIIAVGWTESTDGDFPTRHQGDADGVIARVEANGDLLWATTHGGSGSDVFMSVAEATSGHIVVAGATKSNNGDFPKKSGGQDALAARFNADGKR